MTTLGPVRLRDVAKAAGVSTTSVSRYLNGHIVLPEKTAIRILAAVNELGYRPNAIARRLSIGESETLGIITTDIAYPFFAAVASAAEAEASERGYSMAIYNSRNDVDRELHFLSRITDRQVDGILFMTNHVDDGRIARQIDQTRRVVLIDEDVSGATAPRVFADNERGGRLAARHLLDHGHTRIAFIGGPKGLISADERFAGLRAGLAEAGVSLDPEMVLFGAYDEEFGVTGFRRLWSAGKRPTAVFAPADMLAIGVIRAARDLGIEVPSDLSVIGFDDLLHANLLNPPLTTVRHSATEFGRIGVRLLVGEIDGRPTADRPVRIPVELIVRGSVARPRSERSRVRRRQAPAAQAPGAQTPRSDGRRSSGGKG